MLQILIVLALLYDLACLIVGYFDIFWGWMMLTLPLGFVILMLISSLFAGKPNYCSDLSEDANRLLAQCHPHYRLRNISQVFALIGIYGYVTAIILAVIGCCRDFWWGIAIAAIVVVMMQKIANIFHPLLWIIESERALSAHQEIIAFLDAPKIARNDMIKEAVKRHMEKERLSTQDEV